MRVALIALVSVALGACGLFGSRPNFDNDAAGRPLAIPPGLDSPGINPAMSIPEGGTVATTSDASAAPRGAPPAAALAATPAANAATLRVEDSVSGTWTRVALALERAAIAEIVARDEVAASFTVRGTTRVDQQVERGFFGRLFGRDATRRVETDATRVVRITADGDMSVIRIEDESGNVVDDDFARRLIGAIAQRIG